MFVRVTQFQHSILEEGGVDHNMQKLLGLVWHGFYL